MMDQYTEILDKRIDVFFLFRKEALNSRFKMRMQYFFIFLYLTLSSTALLEFLITDRFHFTIKLITIFFLSPFLTYWIFYEKVKLEERKSKYKYFKEKTINMFAGIFEMRGVISSSESKVVLNYLDEKLLLVSANV